ncbi:hypothetical protein BABINDRAFT_169270 [Babjeviella inositovora NRRL Y-12698]|uniref:Dienelactone hydrolase domain-containing protein n=1 Tax=Babjeviella inositovora NRRL Y-12698 TaxID=984486 RepID=A0A1E3QI83_9ASCO|nr:uncharacterized protein BABINDRAFT_169270 [Babjeviella inositovora NRRL Y-12698]ODQ77406.1 hypothetical protein BABINDRAFT_169270 [Babjeviella inositovora NRRL Y-12698]
MASKTFGSCCFKTTLHEGTPIGKHEQLFGSKTYIVGENKGKIIVILTDVFGNSYLNNKLIADELSRNGYCVVMPDLFGGDDADLTQPNAFAALQPWLAKHQKLTPGIVDSFLQQLRAEWKPSFVGGIGHCYGAKYVVQHMTTTGEFDAGALAHPTNITVEEVEACDKPLLINAAETDRIFPEELRRKTEDILKANKNVYETVIFGGVTHGFAVRCDPSVPAQRYAKEKTLCDQVMWFNNFSA